MRHPNIVGIFLPKQYNTSGFFIEDIEGSPKRGGFSSTPLILHCNTKIGLAFRG
jgi:hypothetical protein